MKRAARIIIQGTVQGVFFRQFVKENADKLKIKGLVRNIENNDVEIIAEGEKEKIDSLIRIVTKGPKHSQIRNVKAEERKWSDSFEDFKILRF